MTDLDLSRSIIRESLTRAAPATPTQVAPLPTSITRSIVLARLRKLDLPLQMSEGGTVQLNSRAASSGWGVSTVC